MNQGIIILIIVLVGLILFITEKFPLPVTAMLISIACYFTGAIDAKETFKAFGSTNVMIIAAMAILGEALFRTGAAAQIGIVLRRVAKTERTFIFAITVVGGILSGFLSNTGCAALLIALTLGICQSTGFKRNKLMYPIILGCCFGGGITTVGSNSTLFLKQSLEEMGNGQTMAFFELAPLSLILIVVAALYISTIGYKLMPEEPRNELEDSYGKQMDYSKVPGWKKTLSYVILILTVVFMYFEDKIGVNLAVTAVIGAAVCVIFNLVTVKEATRCIPLTGIMVYACMVPVSTALENSGAAQMIADLSMKVLGGISNPVVVLTIFFIAIIPVTLCMSNSATVYLFAPIALAISASLGMNPKAVLICIRMAATMAVATPIAMPMNAMAVEPGGYNFMDFVKPGVLLTVIASVISIAYIAVFYPLYL